MCEFHLRGNCFHPEIVGKGTIAKKCDVHSCKSCTDKRWQLEKINKEIEYHQALLNLALSPGKEVAVENGGIVTNIDQRRQRMFKNPFENTMDKKGF